MADQDAFIAHLRRRAAGDEVSYERQLRRQVAVLAGLRKERWSGSSCWSKLPSGSTRRNSQTCDGIQLAPGRITANALDFTPEST
jgi:hypothetical protein